MNRSSNHENTNIPKFEKLHPKNDNKEFFCGPCKKTTDHSTAKHKEIWEQRRKTLQATRKNNETKKRKFGYIREIASESSENEEKDEEEDVTVEENKDNDKDTMEEDILHLLDEKEKKTIDNMGENINHEENIQHDNRTCKNHTDITIKTKNEKKKTTPPTSWEK